MQQRVAAALLLAVICLGFAAAISPPKVVKVTWSPPANSADEMDRPKLLNCGDTLHLKCPPGARHGVYKIANVTGSCPKNFVSPVYGQTLLPPTPDCDLKINLTAGDDYFLTSQVPGECHNGMKMLVKVFCDSGVTTTSKLKLGQGVKREGNRTLPHHFSSNTTARVSSGAAGAASAGLAFGAAAVLAAGLLL